MALTKTSITHLVIISLLAAIPLSAQARIVRSLAAKTILKLPTHAPLMAIDTEVARVM